MQLKNVFIPLMAALLVSQVSAQQLDTTSFVVMGEGMAAGMANFGLSSVMQTKSFPALIAAQMNTAFPQPLIQPPGIGDVVGYPTQEVKVQTYPQGSVRQFYLPTDPKLDPIGAPPLFVLNLSVPAQTLNDSVTLKPVAPIVQKDMKQTVYNLLLGFPQLILDNVPLWTQFEYAKAMFPTVAMVELGYYEVLNAAVAGDPKLLPDPTAFGNTYLTVVSGLRNLQAQVIVTTIPNPLDTAYFNSLAAAAAIDQTTPTILNSIYHPDAKDYITRNGIQEIANQLFNGAPAPLSANATFSAANAAAVTANVNALNAQIVNVAKAKGAVVYDLNAFLHQIKTSGAVAGKSAVTGDYLGGFYSLDAVYPGATGHALIANDILTFLNQTYHRSFSLVDLSSVASNDPTLQNFKPRGQAATSESLNVPSPDLSSLVSSTTEALQ